MIFFSITVTDNNDTHSMITTQFSFHTRLQIMSWSVSYTHLTLPTIYSV